MHNKSLSRSERINKIIAYFFLILYALFTIIPVYWVFVTSIKPSKEVVQFPPSLIPKTLSLEHYNFVLTKTDLARGVLNSLIIASATTAIAILIGSLGGYAFSRFKFKGQRPLMLSILILYLIPPAINVIPLFLMFHRLHLLNTYWGLIIAYQGMVLPLATIMLKNYFDAIPKEVEEAALVDGCRRSTVFWRITMPLTLPGLSTTAIFSFILSWNEFVLALNFLSKEKLATVQLVVMSFVKLHRIDWGALTAAMVIAMLPVLVFVLFAQRYIISGLLRGSTKY